MIKCKIKTDEIDKTWDAQFIGKSYQGEYWQIVCAAIPGRNIETTRLQKIAQMRMNKILSIS